MVHRLSHEDLKAYRQQRIEMDRHVADEMQRAPEHAHRPGANHIWRCLQCPATMLAIDSQLPEPGALPHHNDCCWLAQWYEFPASLREAYQREWFQRNPGAKRLIRCRRVPSGKVLITPPIITP